MGSTVHPIIEQTHLDHANRHINAALARLDWLEGVLLEHQRNGLDPGLADSLLHNMRVSLCLMIRHRLSVRRSLAQAGRLGPLPSAHFASPGAAPPAEQPNLRRAGDRSSRRPVAPAGVGRAKAYEIATLFSGPSLAG